ncbi:metallophosphoesterase family protein [Thermocrinis minervae]|uniref:Nuclease SbcCD subunit D n=1 Tax=Thermocrinis minervae TaxID=381751 RepID=A0A1M6QK98_9AQUI|nr:exonuclease subunit SbcD [Thermocrinis minervae]SHK20457.1 Exodeoxyribonuclease I subunit D [Thermocrinis minervae]
MKLLHISDLHAGKTLNKISRIEDLEYALEQVKDVCQKEGVEVLLIAGDVYDRSIPDAQSEEVIMNFLTDMALNKVHVVLIAGNHDSYDKIKTLKHMKKLSSYIHPFDRPSRNLDSCIFHYKDLAVACLPYPSERLLTKLSEDSHRTYAEVVQEYIRALANEVEKYPNRVLLAHLHVEGVTIGNSERKGSLAEFYAIRQESIPSTFDYVALGHIHKHQRLLRAPTKAYYSGNLYQLDFSETNTDKFINLVIFEGNQVKVESIQISLKRKLVKETVDISNPIEEFLDRVAHTQDLYWVELKSKGVDLSLNLKKQKIQEVLGDRLVKLTFVTDSKPTAQENVVSIDRIDLVDLYSLFYRTYRGVDPSGELIEEFKKLLREAEVETS